MIDNEIRRLAHAINDLRPDWPISSLNTFIGKNLDKRTYRDAAVALVWIATDTKIDGTPASDTPKRVLEAGPWWTAATAHDGKPRGNYPPKRDEECPKHPGKHRDSCGGCVADELAVEYDEPAPTPIKATGDATTWADRIRADLRAEVRGETA